MLGMMNEITDKPEWDRKVNDETIVERWKKEALGKEAVDFSDLMFDYVSKILQPVVSTIPQSTYLAITPVHRRAPR